MLVAESNTVRVRNPCQPSRYTLLSNDGTSRLITAAKCLAATVLAGEPGCHRSDQPDTGRDGNRRYRANRQSV